MHLIHSTRPLLICMLCAAGGCAGPRSGRPAQGPTDSEHAETASAQIARGRQYFGSYCASCHGDSGAGTSKAPPLVGEKALPLGPPAGAKVRKVQFRTALDVGKWVMQNMPGDQPRSLTREQYLAILAFDLSANGVELEAPLTVERAASIVLHP